MNNLHYGRCIKRESSNKSRAELAASSKKERLQGCLAVKRGIPAYELGKIFHEPTNVTLYVMLRVPRLTGQAFCCGSIISPLPNTISRVALRSVSTGSAIHRGIRKSTLAGSRDSLRPRYDGAKSRLSFGEEDRARVRSRRPHYEQQQDVDDRKESRRVGEGRLSPRQQKYSRDGREESATPLRRSPPPRISSRYSDQGQGYKDPTRSADSGWSDRSSYADSKYTAGDGPERPRFASRYETTGPSSRTGRTSKLPNRAARRASIYGHDEKPPPDYKVTKSDIRSGGGSSVRTLRSRESPISQRPAYSDDRQRRFDYHPRDYVQSQVTNKFRSDSPRFSEQEDSKYEAEKSAPRKYSLRSNKRDDRTRRRGQEHPESFEKDSQHSSDHKSSYTAARGLSEDAESDLLQADQDRRRSAWKVRAPLSIPYTTPASEFLYGTSVVTAALKSDRRKLYKLYLYNGENRENVSQNMGIRKLALSRGVEVSKVQGDWLRMMDKMSAGRPHNGYILEASPLPKLPVLAFKPVPKQQAPFYVTLDHQSREEELINGNQPNIKYQVGFPRFPFVLLLDGIVDPGNLGAIMRTAYFLGVDAVAISNRNSAPFTPVTLKASAGASENLPLMSISQPGSFIDECQKNGWKFSAAVAPGSQPSASAPARKPYYSTSTLGCPTRDHPCVLILGGEGEGLRWNIQKKADDVVGIEGHRAGQGGVDSLNVSVAAGLLCEAFLRRPARNVRNVLERRQDKVSIEDASNVITYDNNSPGIDESDNYGSGVDSSTDNDFPNNASSLGVRVDDGIFSKDRLF